MANVEIYTKSWCPYSVRARNFLTSRGVVFDEIDVTDDTVREREMINRSARTSVPQIFIDGYHVGGSDDLVAADASGLLERLLSDDFNREVA
jgi:glutaredoxin 3